MNKSDGARNNIQNLTTDAIIIVGIIVLVFAQVLNHEFVNFDDDVYVENYFISQGLEAESLKRAFTQIVNSNWHPVTVLSFMLDKELYGNNPAGFHLTNLIVHIVNSILIYIVFYNLSRERRVIALPLALLFAIHPLQVESVAWVAERKGVLSALFFLASLSLYLWYRRNRKSSVYIASLLCFGLSLMAKATTVVLPLILVLAEWFLRPAGEKVPAFMTRLKRIAPYFALSIAIGVTTILVHQQSGALTEYGKLPMTTRILNFVVSIKTYITQTFAPHDLAVYYPYPTTYPLGLSILYGFVILAVTLGAYFLRHKNKEIFFGWLWFILLVLPVGGLIQTGAHAHADRYMYLPIAGLIFSVLSIFERSFGEGKFRAIGGTAALGLALLAYGSLAGLQTATWQNSETLFQHAARSTENNFVAHRNLAVHYLREKHYDEAWAHYQESIAINPKNEPAYKAIIQVLLRQDNFSAALIVADDMMENGVAVGDAHRIAAQTHIRWGNYAEAIKQLEEAARLRPGDHHATYALAYAYYKSGKPESALKWLAALENRAAADWRIFALIGDIYNQQGNNQAAAEYYQKTLKLKPEAVAIKEKLKQLNQRR